MPIEWIREVLAGARVRRSGPLLALLVIALWTDPRTGDAKLEVQRLVVLLRVSRRQTARLIAELRRSGDVDVTTEGRLWRGGPVRMIYRVAHL
jgi:hypothetical protein